MTPQHGLQDDVRAGHGGDIAPSLGGGEPGSLGQERHEPTLGLHYTRVEVVGGWFYGVCTCRRPVIVSLAMSRALDAIQWQCPYALADAETAQARQRFDASCGR